MSNALPDIKAKVLIDTSDLGRASGAAKTTSATIKSEIGDKATTHTLRFKESLTTLTEHVAKMPPIVGQTARSLESMTANASSMGAVGIAAAGAAAGLGILAEAANVVNESFVRAAEQTHNLMRVTGESADVASRQIDAFAVLGVGADTATSAMVKLDKVIAQHPAHLAALGVEVAKDVKGNVNMSETLLNVADAYNATTDATAKTNIVLTAFGKSGADMIPILEQGSAKLRQLEKDASVVMTEKDIEQVHQYSMQQKEMQRNFDALKDSAGRFVNEGLGKMYEATNRQIYVDKRLAESGLNASHQTGANADQVSRLADKFRAEWDASEKAKNGLDEFNQTAKATADAAKTAAAELDNLFNAEQAGEHASIALERATAKANASQDVLNSTNDKAKKAVDDVDLKLDAYNKTIAIYGANSDQARTAQDALTSAQDAAKAATAAAADALNVQMEAYMAAGDAAQKMSEETDKESGAAVNAAAAHQANIDKLVTMEATLAPGNPLRARLDDYINRLKQGIPAVMTTTVQLNDSVALDGIARLREASAGGASPRASGGPVVAGRPYLVNENTPHSEIFIPKQSGTITPNASAPGAATHTGGSADMTETNALLRDIASALAAPPTGQTGIEAALYKAVQGSALNRSRGMAGG